MTSNDPNPHDPDRSVSKKLQTEQSQSAVTEKPALDLHSSALMERIVDPSNMERAWRNVKANRGAPGSDGITLDEFSKTFGPKWPEVRQQLLEGTYRPGPARRKSIPKPDGSQRHLGIPNVIDRVIQQAILQILIPIFDPTFSESSFGFRPHRSAHGAIKQVQQTIRSGHRWCVDMDLSKFFDRVQHDVLMTRVARQVHDRRLLKLIGRYLRAGVMVEGLIQPSAEGTMQGGPLSPLLANILLDDLDKELERRGLNFVRYADDFMIFVKSKAAAQRVFRSVNRFLTRKLKLMVNHDKSGVSPTAGVEFLGYQFHGHSGQIRVSPKNVQKFHQRAKSILNRNRGISMSRRLQELRQYLRGWIDYFVLEQRKSLLTELDKWLRRRVRACYWRSWRLPSTRLRRLTAMGVPHTEAWPFAFSAKGPWRLSMTSGIQRALSNTWLTGQGLFALAKRWMELAPKRRTA